jgi:predicted Zn-dependent peptidase
LKVALSVERTTPAAAVAVYYHVGFRSEPSFSVSGMRARRAARGAELHGRDVRAAESSRSGIVNQLAFLDLQGSSEDYLRNYVQRVNALRPGDIQRMAKKHLRDQQMAIVVVGDREAILEQIEPFGTIR